MVEYLMRAVHSMGVVCDNLREALNEGNVVEAKL